MLILNPSEDPMKKITVILPWKKETKGSHQYATDEDVPVSTVYIRKAAIDGDKAPTSIKVEITEGK